jgi:hypothetical protein
MKKIEAAQELGTVATPSTPQVDGIATQETSKRRALWKRPGNGHLHHKTESSSESLSKYTSTITQAEITQLWEAGHDCFVLRAKK